MSRPLKFTDEDLDRLRLAEAMGQIHSSVVLPPEPEVAREEFAPFTVPAILNDYGSIRSGDMKVTFVVPRKWVGAVSTLGMAFGKKLLVQIAKMEDQ